MTQRDADVKKLSVSRPGTKLKTVRVADVEPKPINWLWPEKIARGKLTLISGDPGLGKSLITIALASAVSKGARWPVGGGNAPQGSVILLSDEDAIADTIRPRLDAAGADCTKIHALKMVEEVTQDGELVNRGFNLARDIDQLSAEIEQIGDVALVEIDPVSAYLGGTDSHKNADVRAVLSPLSDMAEKHDVAVVVVTHLNKGSGSAMYRSVGSIAFTAAARTAWAVTKDKTDPARRLMLPVKNNLGNDESGMAYRVETAENKAAVVSWEPNPVEIDVNEALSVHSDDELCERDEIKDWLLEALRDNPTPAKEMKKKAADAGFSWRTIERVKAALGVRSKKHGQFGPWLWWHPDEVPDRSRDPENPEVRHQHRQHRPVSGRGVLGGLEGIQQEDAHEDAEGAQSQNVSPFGESEPLRKDKDPSDEALV